MNSEITSSSFSFAAPDGLKVNLLSSAYGIEKNTPTFSWVMHSNDVADIQTGYRIVIASRLEDMQEQNYLLDTGWTATDESSNITIAGLETLLQDNELYYWAVRLRNKNGAESALSEPACFVTAVGNDWEDTHGIWGQQNEDFCFLRTEFALPDSEGVERAVLHVTASSPEPSRRFVYHLFLNGTFVGLGPTRMGKGADGEELLYYHSYDVTDLLAAGNALGALCYTTEDKAFLCQLTVFYKNGNRRTVLNSARDAEAFTAMNGEAALGSGHSIGTSYYKEEAENINANVFPFGFSRVGFESTDAWLPVGLGDDLDVEHERTLVPYPGEPIGRFEQDVASVERLEDGRIFIDLGNEIIGGLRLTLNAPVEHTIELRYGEELCEDGSVRYEMRTGNVYREQWTLKAGEQTLEGYGLKGFRYVELHGCLAELGEDDVKGIAIRRAFEAEESSFVCSNEVLCRLYDTFKYAICATSQDMYVDSQTRERTPYEGDTLVNMLAAYTYTSDMSLARHTLDYLLSHRTWPAEYALTPVHMVRLDYLYSGNRALLEQTYPTLRRLTLSEKIDPELGLIPVKATGNRWDAVMLDWPVSSRDGYALEESHFNTVYNALYHLILRDMTVMAGVLGNEDDATTFRMMADNLRTSMIEQLYRPDKGAFIDGLRKDGTPVEHMSQHATVYALCMGIYNGSGMKDTMCRTLIGLDDIKMSIYGSFFLLDGLYRAGHGAYATALLANDDCTPGAHTFAAALANHGITIAPEAWCVEEKPNMTFSHPWGASPAALIVRGMFGIQPTRPGFHKFEVWPQIGSLPYAAIRVPTVKGTIAVSIGQNNEAYEAEVVVPPNTKATVYLPVLPGGTDTLFINSQISNFPIEDGCYHIELGSGTHRLLAQ
ncbi:MAG: family 78 glycoside hydrolase catalytic domain [Clostridia bacterium]|nr:family 78 glycoside hydrolase catalytic domain [Clostridia bacterium]